MTPESGRMSVATLDFADKRYTIGLNFSSAEKRTVVRCTTSILRGRSVQSD